ncbi:MAG: glycosyltransferase [Saprospiraceae bacterium]
MPTRIFYLTPDNPTPSWGMAMLYHHVRLLNKNGFAAFVLHQQRGVQLDWLDFRPPVRYLKEMAKDFLPTDVLVVPEILAGETFVKKLRLRKIVFVQGGFLIHQGLKKAKDYQALGYESAMVVMPHLQRIVETFFGIKAVVVPPFIADYFFISDKQIALNQRSPQIVLFPKAGYQEAGYFDYEIIERLVRNQFEKSYWQKLLGQQQWQIIKLENKSHREVAGILKKATFFINTNCFESLNATVAEAMAAGCIPLSYEAYGGQDYLKNEENAFVFPNNYVYPLAEKLFDLIDNFADYQPQLAQMRSRALTTVKRYAEVETETALLAFFQSLLLK